MAVRSARSIMVVVSVAAVLHGDLGQSFIVQVLPRGKAVEQRHPSSKIRNDRITKYCTRVLQREGLSCYILSPSEHCTRNKTSFITR